MLKQWLVRYKFKDWTEHRTTSPGSPVTEAEKEERAGQIAERLSDNNHWHSHGRMIGMQTLRDEMKLQIDDFGQNVELRTAIRRYSDTLSDFLGRADVPFYVFNRNL